MQVYKFFDFPDQQLISDRVYEYVRDKTNVLQKRWEWNTLHLQHFLQAIPEIEQSVKTVFPEERIVRGTIFYRDPGTKGLIHVDHGGYTRLLWPIKNCQGSFTKFYDQNGNRLTAMRVPQGEPVYHVERDNPISLIDSVELTRPILFRTYVPHGIWTNPEFTEARLTMILTFDRPMDHYLD